MNETFADSPRWLVKFGVFELDLRAGELRKSGTRVSLQQQPLQLLSVLLETPGELVTREELRKRLWPEDTFVDFEHGLNAAVKRLRDALGDSAESPRFIETVPRRGYRFIGPISQPAAPPQRERGSRRLPVKWAWVIAALGGASALALGILRTHASMRPSAEPVVQLTTGSDLSTEPAISPDGEWMAYASDRGGEGHLDIWMQRVGRGDPLRLTDDPADDREPTFSADGSRIAFRSEREGGGIYVIPAHTGADARVLVRHAGAHGPRFSPDGRWLAYSTGPGRFSIDKATSLAGQTYLVPSTGGASIRLLPDFDSVCWPVWSPDSRHLLLTARRRPIDGPEWWVVTSDGQSPVKINIDVGSGTDRFPVRAWNWIAGNSLVYSGAFGGDSWDLWEVGITPGAWTASAKPKRLTTGAGLQAYATIVPGGRLIFASLSQTVNVWAVPLEANSGRVVGAAQRVIASSRLQWWPSASNDGRRVVFRGERPGTGGIWLKDFDNGHETLLASGPTAYAPIITGDGSRVAYVALGDRWAIHTVAASGGATETLCADCGDGWISSEDWSSDNTRVLYETGNPTAVFVLDIRSGTKRLALQRSAHDVWQARFSPDDRWISLIETIYAEGRARLWIAPSREGATAAAADRVAVTNGDSWDDKPRWSPDGNLLYFTSQRDGFLCLWAQRLRPDTKQPIGAPFPVYHIHSARLSLNNTGFVGLDMTVARDRILINLGELSGNIWTTLVP